MKNTTININGFQWVILFVDKEHIKGFDGQTLHNERNIKIRNDLDYIATEITLKHELTHALLGTQGRCYQTKFSVEELCEFVAYCGKTIQTLCDQVLGNVYE